MQYRLGGPEPALVLRTKRQQRPARRQQPKRVSQHKIPLKCARRRQHTKPSNRKHNMPSASHSGEAASQGASGPEWWLRRGPPERGR